MKQVSKVILVAAILFSPGARSQPAEAPKSPAPATAFVRVNQVGYAPDEPKLAVLMSSGDEAGATFSVIDAASGKAVFTAPLTGRSQRWGKTFGDTYALDFSKLATPGTYTIVVSGPAAATSPSFRIDRPAALYAPLVANAAAFYTAQHDVHQGDVSATVYETPTFSGNSLKSTVKSVGGPIDVSGGWYDAGDYIEFVETASYADAALLLTARDHPGSPVTAEARRGLEWLLKMWDPATGTLYYQIGIGDGNDAVHGDHDAWRLPAADDALKARAGDPDYFRKHRPVFRAGPAGTPVSPNLAGRLAAAFALGHQVFRTSDPALAERCLKSARSVFAAAKTDGVKKLLTTAPFEYYGESEWRDDMEWGATELFLTTGEKAFLQSAAHWAKAYTSNGSGDVPNLYDVGAVAHYELARVLDKPETAAGLEISRQELIDALRKQLDEAAGRAAKDPFGLGLPYHSGDLTPHVIGLALEASFYDELTGTSQFESLGRNQRRWILGGNPWGVCFIVGAGSTFPHCLHHQIANLTGGALIGAVVDGPSGEKEVAKTLKDLPDGARPCPADKSDAYEIFSAQGVRFADNVAAYSCTEPAIDYAALSALLFSRQK